MRMWVSIGTLLGAATSIKWIPNTIRLYTYFKIQHMFNDHGDREVVFEEATWKSLFHKSVNFLKQAIFHSDYCSYFEITPSDNRVDKTRKHGKRCLGNILDVWGTFWTKINTILVDIPICQKSCIFHDQK